MGRVDHRQWRSFAAVVVLGLLAVGPVAAEGVGEAQVRVDLERFVRARVADPEAKIEVPRLATFSIDRVRHKGVLRTEMSSRSKTPFSGRVPVTVALYAGDVLVKRGVVSPTVRSLTRAVVPKRDLRRGEILSAADLELADKDQTRLPLDAVFDIEQAIGLRTKRSVRKGFVLRQGQIERIPVVERGDRVTLVLRTGLIEIQAIGRSQETGAAGDWIRVRNLDSKRELSGQLDRNGMVHVAF